jgi:hypothetical protein
LTILVGQESVMSAPSPIGALVENFAELENPRVERTKRHSLLSILAIARCGVLLE